MSPGLRSRRTGTMTGTMSGKDHTDIHLLVILHGLWGSTKHLNSLESAAVQVASESVSASAISNGGSPALQLCVLKPESNALTKLYDGIDVCASRVAWEVEREVERLERERGVGRVRELSVAGYSCGGLIAKYMIGILHARSFFTATHCRPRTFSCIATPHLGILYHHRNFWEWVAKGAGWTLLGRTGAQLYLKDEVRGGDGGEQDREQGAGMLEEMVRPDGPFIGALNLFPRVLLFANACQDRTVPYPTATMNLDDPFVELASDHTTELVVEVDDDNIVIDWSHRDRSLLDDGGQDRRTMDGEDDQLLKGPTNKRRTRGRRRGWSWRVGKGRFADENEQGHAVLKRPGSEYLPSLLKVRWPWSLAVYAASPVIFAIGYPIAIAVFVVHTLQSHHRIRRLSEAAKRVERGGRGDRTTGSACGIELREDGLSPGELEAIMRGWSADRGDSLFEEGDPEGGYRSEVDGESMAATRGMRSSGRRSSEDTLVGVGEEANVAYGDEPVGEIIKLAGHDSSTLTSPVTDLTAVMDGGPRTGPGEEHLHAHAHAHRSPLEENPTPTPVMHDATLRLLPAQRRIVEKWRLACAGRRRAGAEPVETCLTYYPEVRNAHAVICCRDLEAGSDPEQEVGLGVVRRWAERTVGLVNKDYGSKQTG